MAAARTAGEQPSVDKTRIPRKFSMATAVIVA